MHRLWNIVDEPAVRPHWSRSLLAGLVIGGGCIILSALGRHLIGVDLPFAAVLVAVVLGAYWHDALTAAVIATIAIPSAVVLNTDHPYVTPINTLVVVLFSIVLVGFAGHMTRLRQRADREAQRSSRREMVLQSIFSTTPAAMLIVDAAGEIVAINQSARRVLGVADPEAQALVLADLLPGPRAGIVGTRTFDRSDGARLTLTISSAMLTIGRTELQTIYIRDDTDAILAADRVARLQADLLQMGRATALGQLGAAIAHEINQPLAAAANFVKVAQVAVARGAAADDIAHPLESSLRHIFGASSVLKRLRDFLQRAPHQPHWRDARQMLLAGTEIGAMAIRQAGADLTIEIAPDLGEILIDATQIQQVVLNLLTNAAEAVAGAPVRHVTLRATIGPPDRCTIAVTDTGGGIVSGFENDVFVPFRSTKPDGLGVGLSISRTIVEAHGGIMQGVTNDGGGATFAFTLPRRPSSGEAGDA